MYYCIIKNKNNKLLVVYADNIYPVNNYDKIYKFYHPRIIAGKKDDYYKNLMKNGTDIDNIYNNHHDIIKILYSEKF